MRRGHRALSEGIRQSRTLHESSLCFVRLVELAAGLLVLACASRNAAAHAVATVARQGASGRVPATRPRGARHRTLWRARQAVPLPRSQSLGRERLSSKELIEEVPCSEDGWHDEVVAARTRMREGSRERFVVRREAQQRELELRDEARVLVDEDIARVDVRRRQPVGLERSGAPQNAAHDVCSAGGWQREDATLCASLGIRWCRREPPRAGAGDPSRNALRQARIRLCGGGGGGGHRFGEDARFLLCAQPCGPILGAGRERRVGYTIEEVTQRPARQVATGDHHPLPAGEQPPGPGCPLVRQRGDARHIEWGIRVGDPTPREHQHLNMDR
mmetsp:Transcript_550/g.1827  ORF Transcript_550/g.1827 Transcript_550/m.1827 type:complete len:331 (+) Transcript_550:3157-4149(+)